jgi:hypothetical protein
MPTLEDVARTAAQLPEVAEHEPHGNRTWSVSDLEDAILDAWISAQTTPPEPIAFSCSAMDAEAQVLRFGQAERRGITLRMGKQHLAAS